VALCVERNRNQARAPEAIATDCRHQCDAMPEKPDAPCAEAASLLRKQVERKPMQRRAPVVWGGVSRPEVHCGHIDATLQELARVGARTDLDAREAGLAEVLRRDPHLERTCPGGLAVLDAIEGLPTRDANLYLVEHCPLPGEQPGNPILQDIRPMSLLALRTLAERWRAVGATSDDHGVMLEILRLASALEGERLLRR